jgi:hypothetical protein
MIQKITAVLSLIVVIGVAPALAHTDGASIEKVVDPYLIDIGYTPELVEEGTQTRFDFSLLQVATNEEVAFDDIWVRFEKDSQVFFAGGLSKQPFGNTGLTYAFTEPGTYEVFVRFSNEGEALAESTFDFPVADGPDAERAARPWFGNPILMLLAGVAFGAVVMWFSDSGKKKI